MNFQQLLNNVTIIATFGDTHLVHSKYAQDANHPFLIRDLSHQTETRVNYLNDLEALCQRTGCNNVMLLVNKASDALYAKLNTFCRYMLLDAGQDMGNIKGFNYFVELGTFDDSNGYTVWAPAFSINRTTEHDLTVSDRY